MTAVFGYFALAGLGIVLGLLGAGGSILTVPILVYLFDVAPSQATGYSLVIVGSVALIGAGGYLRRRQSSPKMALLFGLPAIVGAYATRRYLFPAVPDPVFETAAFSLSKDALVMLTFASFMLVASIAMIHNGRSGETVGDHVAHAAKSPLLIGILGATVGVLAGFVGAGGGFMILPVLVLLGGLPVKVAIGTDLLVIAAQSLLGFVGEVQVAPAIDYGFVARIIALPLVGIVVGMFLNQRVPAALLRKSFGWFVLVMGLYIFGRELVL